MSRDLARKLLLLLQPGPGGGTGDRCFNRRVAFLSRTHTDPADEADPRARAADAERELFKVVLFHFRLVLFTLYIPF